MLCVLSSKYTATLKYFSVATENAELPKSCHSSVSSVKKNE